MQRANPSGILVENTLLDSEFLQREIKVDFYFPGDVSDPSELQLLLINDGQDMKELRFERMLASLYKEQAIVPLFCAAIHAGTERKMEYGIVGHPDYKGHGAKAGAYSDFIFRELIPYIYSTYSISSSCEKSFAGFSLGGLSAMDIVWNNPNIFSRVGVFSGSFWWRSIDQGTDEYDDDKHRIMQQQIRHGKFYPGIQFFFQCGNMDETKDRNQNGIIDSIDDTLDIIKELMNKGYSAHDIFYLELKDGRHDVATWSRALPVFLKWGWGKKAEQ
jgi:enterochelin esterase-like enzyme